MRTTPDLLVLLREAREALARENAYVFSVGRTGEHSGAVMSLLARIDAKLKEME
jgi:hypothetical protein